MSRSAEDVSGDATSPGASPRTAPLTVLFTDIEASTQLTASLGDEEWMNVLRRRNVVVREQVEANASR
jgi:class 3 adenylate cyclase